MAYLPTFIACLGSLLILTGLIYFPPLNQVIHDSLVYGIREHVFWQNTHRLNVGLNCLNLVSIRFAGSKSQGVGR